MRRSHGLPGLGLMVALFALVAAGVASNQPSSADAEAPATWFHLRLGAVAADGVPAVPSPTQPPTPRSGRVELTNIQFGTLVVVGTSGGKPYGHVDVSFDYSAFGHPEVVIFAMPYSGLRRACTDAFIIGYLSSPIYTGEVGSGNTTVFTGGCTIDSVVMSIEDFASHEVLYSIRIPADY